MKRTFKSDFCGFGTPYTMLNANPFTKATALKSRSNKKPILAFQRSLKTSQIESSNKGFFALAWPLTYNIFCAWRVINILVKKKTSSVIVNSESRLQRY